MLHFGLKNLRYTVEFDNSCYYPIVFNKERKKTKLLFGTSFGYRFKNNSISISRRPSDSHLEKIDLFAYIYNNGNLSEDYIGSVDTNKKYFIVIKFEPENKCYRIKIFDNGSSVKKEHHMGYFEFPSFRWGYVKKRINGQLIYLERDL